LCRLRVQLQHGCITGRGLISLTHHDCDFAINDRKRGEGREKQVRPERVDESAYGLNMAYIGKTGEVTEIQVG